jgi:hypothetical protein
MFGLSIPAPVLRILGGLMLVGAIAIGVELWRKSVYTEGYNAARKEDQLAADKTKETADRELAKSREDVARLTAELDTLKRDAAAKIAKGAADLKAAQLKVKEILDANPTFAAATRPDALRVQRAADLADIGREAGGAP